MKVTKIVVLAGALALTSGATYAAEVPDFKKADVNADKAIDASEFEAAKAAGVKKTLEELDKDKDGKLSRKEYSVILDADCE